jgi:uncharacterized protein DUF4352
MRRRALILAAVLVACLVACKKEQAPLTPPAETSASAHPARDPRFELSPPVPMAPTVSLGETPSAPAALPGVGDTASAADYQITLKTVRECKIESYLQPRAENVTLGVELAIEGTRERDVPVSPFHAKLEDADGKTYAATLAGCRPILPSVRVAKGERVEGWVSFELPKSARDPKLSYEPTIIGSPPQPLRFSLGR